MISLSSVQSLIASPCRRPGVAQRPCARAQPLRAVQRPSCIAQNQNSNEQGTGVGRRSAVVALTSGLALNALEARAEGDAAVGA